MELYPFQLILLLRPLPLHLEAEDVGLELLVLRPSPHESVFQSLYLAFKSFRLLPQTQVVIGNLDFACICRLLEHFVLVYKANELHADIIVLVLLLLQVALEVEVVLLEGDELNFQLFLVVQSFPQLVL